MESGWHRIEQDVFSSPLSLRRDILGVAGPHRRYPPMFTVFKDFSFSAAHQIRGHQGGCQNLHGHNYRVRVYVRARELDALGMVIDFADLKKIVAAVVDPFDHQFLNDIPPFNERNTTAELLSQYIFEEIAQSPAGGAGAHPGGDLGDGQLLRDL